MPDTEMIRAAESAVRALASTAKALRLYPPTSPIPLQAMHSAIDALGAILATQPAVPLVVARQGFTFLGAPVTVTGADDLAGMLTAHGIAELDILPGCTTDDLAALFSALLRDPAEVQSEGGVAAVLALAGASGVAVSGVVLTAAVTEVPAGEDVDEFLRELAADEERLAAWLAAAAAGDPGALADGLAELARAAGPQGAEALERVLGSAFLKQDVAARDTLVGLALGSGEAAPVIQRMMHTLRPADFAASLADGLYARNMLSMSNVLSALPKPEAVDAIIEELRPLLASGGHSERELSFLGHMLEVRNSPEPEVPLVERQAEYRTVAALTKVGADELDRAHAELASSEATVNARTVNTLRSLLDQQQDFALWSRTLSALATLVPRLIVQGDLTLAGRVLADLATRESRTTQPWPGLADEVQKAIDQATSSQALGALLTTVLDDPGQAPAARDVLRHASAQAQQRLVVEAIGQRERNGLAVVEDLIGRRLIDLLVAAVPEVQWFQVGPVAQRLAADTDPRAQAALSSLATRPDERSRQEVAKALSDVSTPSAVAVLGRLAGDPVVEVAVLAVRSLGAQATPGAAQALGTTFDAIDADTKDFPLAREIVGALGRSPDPAATEVLQRIAGRKALIKRGHFAEIHDLARRALENRTQGGART